MFATKEQMINGYEIKKMLASGGQSNVYLVYKDSVPYVMKTPKNFFSRDDIEKEYKILSKIKHRGIIKIKEFNNQYPYIVYPYIRGCNILRWSIGKQKREKIRCFIKLCRSVQVLHKKFTYHCDLKPSNIIIENNKPYLIDFGSCKTKEFSRVNTYNTYSPAETIGGIHSSKTDIYCLGLILYEILNETEVTPETNDEMELLQYHRSLKLYRGIESYQTFSLIKRMTDKSPHNRTNIGNVIKKLEPYI